MPISETNTNTAELLDLERKYCSFGDTVHYVEPPKIFVGDGLSDKYAAASADLVFAKDQLAAFCREQQIAHRQYISLADVAEQLDELLRSDVAFEREAIEEVGA